MATPASTAATTPRSHSMPELPTFDLTTSVEFNDLSRSETIASGKALKVVQDLELTFKEAITVGTAALAMMMKGRPKTNNVEPALSTRKFSALRHAEQRTLVALATEVALLIQVHNTLLYNAIQAIEKNEDFRASLHVRVACMKYI